LNIAHWGSRILRTLAFFWDARWLPTTIFAAHESVFVIALFALASFVVGGTFTRLDGAPARRQATELALTGLAVFVLGSLPYLAIGQVPAPRHFASRFAVASQFGALIGLALLIVAVHGPALRAAVLTVVVFVFAVQQFQMGKWMLYEEQVLRSFREDMA